MVATGVGITVLPYTSVSGYAQISDLLTIRPFAPPVPTRTVALAWRKSFPRPKVITLLADQVVQRDQGQHPNPVGALHFLHRR
jgi:LysR family hydrogen peroxide-inducible transcriptional activator